MSKTKKEKLNGLYPKLDMSMYANKGRLKLPKAKDLTVSEFYYLINYFKEVEKLTSKFNK